MNSLARQQVNCMYNEAQCTFGESYGQPLGTTFTLYISSLQLYDSSKSHGTPIPLFSRDTIVASTIWVLELMTTIARLTILSIYVTIVAKTKYLKSSNLIENEELHVYINQA